jgi:hypothetical protein
MAERNWRETLLENYFEVFDSSAASLSRAVCAVSYRAGSLIFIFDRRERRAAESEILVDLEFRLSKVFLEESTKCH